MYLANMTWQQAEKAFAKENLVALIPVGSIEQHGPVGPLGTDYIIPTELACRIERRTEVLVVPGMPFGVATHHVKFPGTIDIGYEALYSVMTGITNNLLKHGIKKFIFINGHGGNTPVLERVGLDLNQQGAIGALIDWWVLAPQLNPEWIGGHGDGQEVSAIMAIDERLVDLHDVAKTHVSHLSPDMPNVYLGTVKFKGALVKVMRDVRSVVDSGGYGGPTDSSQATRELGVEMLQGVTDYIIDFIEEFKKIKTN